MDRLFITKIDEQGITLPKYLNANTQIALKSAVLWIGHHNLWQDLTLNIKKVGEKQPSSYLYISAGFYTPKVLMEEINKSSAGVIEIRHTTSKNTIYFKVQKGYLVSATKKNIYTLLGISDTRVTHEKWVKEGIYYGTPTFYAVKGLRLYCHELDEEQTGLDDEKSKLFQYFPLNKEYDFGDTFTYDYVNPTFRKINSSIDRLHFKMTDEYNYKDLPLAGIRLEILIKNG